MTKIQTLLLTLILAGTLTFSWTMLQRSTALRNYRWFQAKVATQKKINLAARQVNARLKRRVTALQYDHRVIERVARDHLSLTREGEIIVILPR